MHFNYASVVDHVAGGRGVGHDVLLLWQAGSKLTNMIHTQDNLEDSSKNFAETLTLCQRIQIYLLWLLNILIRCEFDIENQVHLESVIER